MVKKDARLSVFDSVDKHSEFVLRCLVIPESALWSTNGSSGRESLELSSESIVSSSSAGVSTAINWGAASFLRSWFLWVFVRTVKDRQPCVLLHHLGTSTQWYSSGCVGGDIYRFLQASAVQPEGPCEMFDAVLVLIFICCPGLSTSPVPVLYLSSTYFVSIVTLSPCTTSDEQWSEKLTENPNLCVVFKILNQSFSTQVFNCQQWYCRNSLSMFLSLANDFLQRTLMFQIVFY